MPKLPAIYGATIEYVQSRLAEAAETLRRLPMERPRGLGNTWPDFVRSYAESFGSEAERIEFVEEAESRTSSSRQIDEMEEAISWLSWLKHDLPRLVWARAGGCPWWQLEKRPMRLARWRRRYNRDTLRFHYRRGLGIIAKRLAAPKSIWEAAVDFADAVSEAQSSTKRLDNRNSRS